jgi:uncharacterized protein (DUF488 family)
MKIWTIGYEGATQAEVVATLKAAGITLLIDVRAVPLSRKPGFSKNALAAGLREAGIDYAHLKALGTPPEGREAARKGRHDILEAVYTRQLEQPEAIVQAAQMLELSNTGAAALLCFERDPAACHRSLLLNHVASHAEVVNLFIERDLSPDLLQF